MDSLIYYSLLFLIHPILLSEYVLGEVKTFNQIILYWMIGVVFEALMLALIFGVIL